MLTLTSQQTARIKEAAPLQDVIGEYVRLRPSGPNRWMGLCPFHNEKSASLTVHKDGFYKCFACGAGGDVITFVQAKEGVNFPQAVRSLAERYGVTLEETRTVTPAERASAAQLAAECSWFWMRFRQAIARRQHGIVGCERRATAFLADRVADADTPGIEFAWFWLWAAPTLWARLQAVLDWAAELAPLDAMRVYLGVRARFRVEHDRERAMWAAWRGEILRGIGAAR